MHVGIMENTNRSLDGFTGQKINEAQARAEIAGRQSNYMTNMILPDIVQSSKNFPLGPDCVITRDEVPDQSILLGMDLYWLISLEKGCVECRVSIHESGAGKQAVTQDPRVIVTRKPRRFEAFCCAVCRQNFVTVVQALLHMKAFHRKGKKILIQDQNVFHDIEKAMEVPPVPLPWYVSKRTTEPITTTALPFPASTEIQTAAAKHENAGSDEQATSDDGDINPVALLLQAVLKEYKKPVKSVLFGNHVRHVTIQFEDQTTLVVHLPDISKEVTEEPDSSDTLEFKIQRLKAESDMQECMLHANNPSLAQKLLVIAIKKGVTGGSVSSTPLQTDENKQNQLEKTEKPSDQQPIKRDSRGRPSKTVRFMLGAPDSDEDGSSSASERIGGRDSASPLASQSEATPQTETKTPEVLSDDKSAKDDEGLKGVVSQLISTASKGVIPAVPSVPTSVLATSIQEEVITNAAFHARFMPKNLSVPNLPSISIAGSDGLKSSIVPTSSNVSTGLIRVQSWGGLDPNNRTSLGPYTPHVPLNIAREDLRRSFAAGRSFTYAEKIKLMNKLNDEDALITREHVKGAGKLIGGESSKGHIPSVASLPTFNPSVMSDKPLSPTVTAATGKMTKSESDLGVKIFPGSESSRRKRRSKYDIDQFTKFGTTRHLPAVSPRETFRTGSDGSISDKDETEDNPPTLVGLLRNRAALLAGRTVPGVTPAVMSDSDYYGSGEWANAAMSTLRQLQSAMNSVKGNDELTTAPGPRLLMENVSALAGHAAPADSSATPPPFVSLSSEGPVDSIVALAQQITSERAHLKHLKNPGASASQSKRPRSPHGDEADRDTFEAVSSSTSGEEPQAKRLKSTSERTPKPDSNLKRPAITSTTQPPHVIAEPGDGLLFTERVTEASLQDSNKIILKFSKSGSSDGDQSMDMPHIFANSVDTFMKLRYIEKFARCKVCGFATPVDTVSNTDALKAHVMEHSLKELLQAGCSPKQL